mmetsp:Transcript_42565/g.102619  ORF Transcript_42565/g.102619 Transcript_42565/m.102619 type:complete len:146 (+) Transcript_42565:253-690(+)|eukprot:CAMPEP_0113459372 /NCGR_PEP_ID=MMETSP0014_2-20120614/10417_1 /TAXON_ID=2857 /ORGANISM="Nitzschia sp." /LENGTH=145 /DNA_ID=CAMNT_0000350951 /DNA_START=63 /DNA_END=500 /DNA_ORIENTATION=- /assembly_acc=CAM_ASM_000159
MMSIATKLTVVSRSALATPTVGRMLPSAIASSSSSVAVSSRSTAGGTTMQFSSDCQPAERLKQAFEFYRQENYTQEVPSRFKKELLSPYTHHGAVTVDELNRLLGNIGRSDVCLSKQEQQELLKAAGISGKTEIPTSKLMELIVV